MSQTTSTTGGEPGAGSSGTVTITPDQAATQRSLEVIQLSNNMYGFGYAQPPTTTPTGMPQTGGHTIGSGPPSQANSLLAQLARERMARTQGAQGGTQTVTTPQGAPQTSSTSQGPTTDTGMPSSATPTTVLRRTGSGPPGPPGGGSSTTTAAERGIAALLLVLLEQRRRILAALNVLLEQWWICPLVHLDSVFAQFMKLQGQMQRLEIELAGRVMIASGGPPGDPPPGGSSTRVGTDDPQNLRLRLAPNPARERFQQAQLSIQAQQAVLLAGQQARSQQRERFDQARGLLQAQQGTLLAGQQARSQRRDRFDQAMANLALAPPPPQPTLSWQNLVQRHANFVQALGAMQNAPPPIQPGPGWHRQVQMHQNFLLARANLQNAPPPIQPTQAWHRLRQQHLNFQQALLALQNAPPRPLLQGPIRNNPRNAPMAYLVPVQRAVHVLHGDHTGGQHMGAYNPGLHGAPPNQITHFHFHGHWVTYFPVAWDAEDILGALTEAADATYHLAYQQHNGNWLHPPVWVSRRGITIRIVVVTSVNHLGRLVVWTGWPQ